VGTPPTWIPPGASSKAAEVWKENPWTRVSNLLHADRETIRRYLTAGIESFTAQEMAWAIHNGYDVLPGLINKGTLNHLLLGPFARKIIRLNWKAIHDALTHQNALIADIAQRDPQKGRVLSTPEGRRWIDWTTYRVHAFLRVYAKIEGAGRVLPPPGECPIRVAIALPPE
jgi:hypothetical protein